MYYVKPILITLAKLGVSRSQTLEVLLAMGILSPRKVPYTMTSLNRMLKNELGLTWIPFRDAMVAPIIENLIRYKDNTGNFLSAKVIGQLIGKDGNFIIAFIKRRWGFNTIAEARAFFETRYLGNHDYDYFSFS